MELHRSRILWSALVTSAGLTALVGGCAQPTLPDPAQTDAALDEGSVLPVPIEGAWPRLGLQWTYEVTALGFPPGDHEFPARIAYRLTTTNAEGHPWCGWWMYGSGRGMEFTGATIEDHDVFFHPPRIFGFSDLEYAPFPEASPGRKGTLKGELTLGEGYDEAGSKVAAVHRNVGESPVEAPVGRFERAWLVEANTDAFNAMPGWTARLWWQDRVGWIRMEWERGDGRRIELRLAAVRQVDTGK